MTDVLTVCIFIVLMFAVSPGHAQEWAVTASGFAVTISAPQQEDMEPCLAAVPGAQGFPPRMCPKAKLFDVQWAWS